MIIPPLRPAAHVTLLLLSLICTFQTLFHAIVTQALPMVQTERVPVTIHLTRNTGGQESNDVLQCDCPASVLRSSTTNDDHHQQQELLSCFAPSSKAVGRIGERPECMNIAKQCRCHRDTATAPLLYRRFMGACR